MKIFILYNLSKESFDSDLFFDIFRVRNLWDRRRKNDLFSQFKVPKSA